MNMFCFQCQEAAKGIGCTIGGVCGKKPDVSNLQDLLIHLLKGISIFSTFARKKGYTDNKVNRFIIDSLFTTITNANFDKEVFYNRIRNAIKIREDLKNVCKEKGIEINGINHDAATWESDDNSEFDAKAKSVGILSYENEDIRSLVHLVLFGIKGMAAYAEHASNLGFEKEEIHAFIQKALAEITRNDLTVEELFSLVMETGKFGVEVMALLDKANTDHYGNPEITKVDIGVRNNPGILISGHDLRDLEDLLEQTEGSGVDVYTHSEMLPAHYYPFFKKYKSFAGNYGNAWWKQREEFETFNGPILFTTNCLVPPPLNSSYRNKVFTTGAAGFAGCKHIPDRTENTRKDFSEIISLAKKCKPPTAIENGEIVGGFAHAQLTSLADKIVDAVKSGAIRKFIVMAGCDGRMKEREYYTRFAEKLPKDTVILTAGCAKYRYNKLPLGYINGIPRVLDAGQCNDSYSLAVIALKLKEIFKLNDINDLPIAYNIAWYEQKAVIVLLALLYLGVKKIHLGPSLPAFLSPNITKILVEKFGISGIESVDEDIKILLN